MIVKKTDAEKLEEVQLLKTIVEFLRRFINFQLVPIF